MGLKIKQSAITIFNLRRESGKGVRGGGCCCCCCCWRCCWKLLLVLLVLPVFSPMGGQGSGVEAGTKRVDRTRRRRASAKRTRSRRRPRLPSPPSISSKGQPLRGSVRSCAKPWAGLSHAASNLTSRATRLPRCRLQQLCLRQLLLLLLLQAPRACSFHLALGLSQLEQLWGADS